MEPKQYLKGKELYYCLDCGVQGNIKCENCHGTKFMVHYLQDDVFAALEQGE